MRLTQGGEEMMYCSSVKDCGRGSQKRRQSVEQDSGPGLGSSLSVDLWGSFWRQVMEQLKHACVTQESAVCQFNWAVGARACLVWSVLGPLVG